MRQLNRFSGVLVALFALGALILPAQAQKRMGPSAKAAARLKHTPPPTWIQHYLPDDRYKIAGKVWKYVTVEVDRYYHLPNSAFMLRQSPARVIGFASAQEAQDAGYRPGPSVAASLVSITRVVSASAAPTPTRRVRVVNGRRGAVRR